MKLTSLLLPALLAITCLWACSGTTSSESIETELRKAERALADGDMTVAMAVAAHLSDDPRLHSMSTRQLGRLSMLYIQLADSIEPENNVDRAADIYDIALQNDPDSTRIFFQSVDPAQLQYAETIAARSATRKNPLDMSRLNADENAFDSISSINHDSL